MLKTEGKKYIPIELNFFFSNRYLNSVSLINLSQTNIARGLLHRGATGTSLWMKHFKSSFKFHIYRLPFLNRVYVHVYNVPTESFINQPDGIQSRSRLHRCINTNRLERFVYIKVPVRIYINTHTYTYWPSRHISVNASIALAYISQLYI